MGILWCLGVVVVNNGMGNNVDEWLCCGWEFRRVGWKWGFIIVNVVVVVGVVG